MTHRFRLVDVFAQAPLRGNPVAVILDSDGLDADEMMRVTRWLNFSETTFLQPSTSTEADYRVRIFTLERELPFAGHPTLGSAHAWLEAGGVPKHGDEIVQECGAGFVRIRRDGEGRLAFAAPPLERSGRLDEAKIEEITRVLGIARSSVLDAQWCDNGPGWAAVLLPSANDVLGLTPARSHPSRLEIGVVGLYEPGSPAAYELRALFSDQHGVLREDPVTGSLNAAVAQWLIDAGRVRPPYLASQGACVGSEGWVHISRDLVGQVWVGGGTTTLFEGEARLGG